MLYCAGPLSCMVLGRSIRCLAPFFDVTPSISISIYIAGIPSGSSKELNPPHGPVKPGQRNPGKGQ